MKDYYEHYRMVDSLLKTIEETSQKRFPVRKLSKTFLEADIVGLAINNGLATMDGEGKHSMLLCTAAGRAHISSGGYVAEMKLEAETYSPSNISFKEHLNDSVNLLTIFGILNAVILFSSDNAEKVGDDFDFHKDGMQFISISMYLLSILVLIELIWNTLIANVRSWKVQTMYFMLCCTTIGMGMLFIGEYGGLIVGLAAFGAYMALAGLLSFALSKLLVRIFKGGISKNVFSFILMASLAGVGMLLRFLIKHFKEVLSCFGLG